MVTMARPAFPVWLLLLLLCWCNAPFALGTLAGDVTGAASANSGGFGAARRTAEPSVKEGQACAAGSAPTPGICATHCRCDGGRWKCCRVRKDYTDMSPAELNSFARSMKAARAHRIIRPWLREVTLRHEITPIRTVHRAGIILVWHRMAVFLLETLIRKYVDCRFAMPYYDSTKYWKKWWKHAPWDSQHLGGDGHGKNCCVSDGPFRAGQWYTFFPQGMAPTCLKRTFNFMFPMTSDKMLSLNFKLHAARDYDQFELGLNHAFHDKVHHLIGGYSHYGTSINDPMFWVFHSFVDKIFTTWQSRGDTFRLFPFSNDTELIGQQPPGVNFTYAQMSDSARLPHNARVCYTSSSPDDGEPYFVPSGTPNTTQWRLNKTQTAGELIASMDKEELEQTLYLFKVLQDRTTVAKWSENEWSDCVQEDFDDKIAVLAYKDGLMHDKPPFLDDRPT